MSSWRRLAGTAGWLLVLASVAVALQLSGRGTLAAPPLGGPDRWAAWLDGRDPVIAAFAVMRIVALGALWYLVAVTIAGVVLRLAGAVRMVTLVDCVTVGPVRRILAGTVGLGLAATGVVSVAAPASRLPVAAASQPAAPATAGTVTMHQLSPTGTAPVAPPAAAPAAPAAAASSDRWTVAPGQCFWSIADSVLTAHLGRAPSDAEIVPYWRRLIDANRATLAHRDNPDLVFPGQVFHVPAPWRPPTTNR